MLRTAAICSVTALGLFSDLGSASKELAAPTRELLPDPSRSAWYREAIESYRETTGTLTPLFHSLAAQQRGAARVQDA